MPAGWTWRRLAVSDQSGFALPLVILAALLISAGALALANRSGQGVMGSIYQGVSLDARDAAEIGLSRIISELNKPNNRGLLRSKDANTDPNPLTSTAQNGLWSSSDLAYHTSQCPGAGTPDLTTNASIGYPSSGTVSSGYSTVYVNDNGSIASSQGSARRSYRLVRVERQPRSVLDIYPSGGVTGSGTITLEVEGRTLRSDGTVIAVSRLRRSFDVVPKCCGTSFGGSFGNVNYATLLSNASGYLSGSICVSDGLMGLGILAGTSLTTTGVLDFTGGSNSINTDSTSIPITNVYCLADAQGNNCITNGTFSTNANGVKATVTPWTVNPRPADFPAAYTYPCGSNNCGSTSFSAPAANKTATDQLTYCIQDTWIDPTQKSLGKKCKSWAINADGTKGFPGGNACTQTATQTHCNVSSIDYKNTDLVFLTNQRQLRLYFNQASNNANDALIDGGTGNSNILQCKAAAFSSSSNTLYCTTAAASARDLAIFGCNSCSPQYFNLYGTASTFDVFMYMPNGEVTLNGNPSFRGVLWTNIIHSTGNVSWIVPGSGLRQVMEYMGLLPQGSVAPASNPPMFDYVARSTSRFRWLVN